MFCFVYLFISYYQISQVELQKKHAHFLEKSKSINKAFQTFYEYMNLLEYRLLNSASRPENVSNILNWRPDSLLDNDFPVIISMKFSLASDPNVTYSRLGIVSNAVPSKINPQETTTYLGNGEFKIYRILRSKEGEIFGWVGVVFSIKHILYKEFAEDEIKIVSTQNLQSGDTRVRSNIPVIPFTLVFSPKIPSFWGFFNDNRAEIGLVLLFGLIVFLAGLSKGRILGGNQTTRLRKRTKELALKLRANEDERQNIAQQLITLQKAAQLKDSSDIQMKNLSVNIQQRYQGMVKHAQAINHLTSKLIAEVGGNNKALNEIRSIAQENTVVLRNLTNGYLMKDEEEHIDLLESIENIKAIFLPEIHEKNVSVEVTNMSKIKPQIDRVIFEIIVYNILRLIMGRLIQNNTIKINITGKDPIKITFQDDGYDVGETIEKITQAQEIEQIWTMNKKTLMGYAQYLGWEIAFVNKSIQSNVIEFLLYTGLKREKLPSNVVSLFECTAHDT